MPYVRFKILLQYAGFKEEDFEFKLVSHDYFRKLGGEAVQRKYLSENRQNEILENIRARANGKERLANWHAKMKRESPEEYYKIQYERFKKVGAYKLKTKRGELVRNQLELEVANIIHGLGLDYSYEVFLMANGSPYFPDFKIGNTIVECTSWRNEEKALKLAGKISDYEASGFDVVVVIPPALRDFYKPIQNHILSANALKEYLGPRSLAGKASGC